MCPILNCLLFACVLRMCELLSRRGCPLRLQVAANNKGIGLVDALIEEYGLPTVQAYMHHIQVDI